METVPAVSLWIVTNLGQLVLTKEIWNLFTFLHLHSDFKC